MNAVIEVTDGVMSESRTNPEVYHTVNDCPNWPEENRPVNDGDMRRNVRECYYCKRIKSGKLVI